MIPDHPAPEFSPEAVSERWDRAPADAAMITDLPSLLQSVQDGLHVAYEEWRQLRDKPVGREPSARMDAFLELIVATTQDEASLRTMGFTDCVWAPKSCPKADAAVVCDACRPMYEDRR